jgi:hypothetical protein
MHMQTRCTYSLESSDNTVSSPTPQMTDCVYATLCLRDAEDTDADMHRHASRQAGYLLSRLTSKDAVKGEQHRGKHMMIINSIIRFHMDSYLFEGEDEA